MQYSVIIPSLLARPILERTVASLLAQTHGPGEILVVVPESRRHLLEDFAELRKWMSSGLVELLGSANPSSAEQRNLGASAAHHETLLFCDDDIVTDSTTCSKLTEAMLQGQYSALSGRMRGASHRVPHGVMRLYYRLQAGYAHPTYGARVFGPAICTLPSYGHDAPDSHGVVPAGWLPSGLLLVRREPFNQAGGFPAFDGYSALEDVYLTARLASRGRIGFHSEAYFDHAEEPSTGRVDPAALARMRMTNRKRVASEVLGLAGWPLWWRTQALRVFDTVALARQRHPGWLAEIRGTWKSLRDVAGDW